MLIETTTRSIAPLWSRVRLTRKTSAPRSSLPPFLPPSCIAVPLLDSPVFSTPPSILRILLTSYVLTMPCHVLAVPKPLNNACFDKSVPPALPPSLPPSLPPYLPSSLPVRMVRVSIRSVYTWYQLGAHSKSARYIP